MATVFGAPGGTAVPAPGDPAPAPTPADGGAATLRRERAVRLPRSPKIIVGLVILGCFVVLAVVGPWLAPSDPSASVAAGQAGPSGAHWLGTSQAGQDILSELLVGARSTLVVTFLAGVVATVLSVVIGVTAGYLGGVVDEVLSMLTNVFLVVPALPLMIVLTGYLPKDVSSNSLVIALIISITGWAWGARVLRAQTLSLRKRDYVEAARVVGEPGWRIVLFEILPNLLAIVASTFLFATLYAIGTFVALAFLAVVDVQHWSWGAILFWANNAQAPSVGAWWWFLPPGLAIALLGTSLALINFGIDEFINPRLRAAGLSRRTARRAGLPRRQQLGLTPVVRRRPRPPDVTSDSLRGTEEKPAHATGPSSGDESSGDRPTTDVTSDRCPEAGRSDP